MNGDNEKHQESHKEYTTNDKNEEEEPKIETVRYLFSDYKAAKLLKSENGCKLISENQKLSGYELYIVEQWACERKLNTVVTTFTGNPQHEITVNIVEIPMDTKLWTSRVDNYFNELVKLHLRPKETSLGLLYVTNLSSFPSNLNLVPVPHGDISQAWDLFYVNENLKRVGCGGRLVLNITAPSNACEDKFRQLFRTHVNVPIAFAAKELAMLVQIVLYYCDLLHPQYADGLICNETIKGIHSWWDKWGQIRHHTKPKEGILGPTTISAIIGFIMGVKLRLGSVIGINKTPKDPFDASYFTESIKQFQKHEHLNKTLKIDDETDERLSLLTDYKFGSKDVDFFGMVKSTMKEVSGKQVLSITDIETLDLDKLKMNVQGARAKYLWHGKGPQPRELPHGLGSKYSESSSTNRYSHVAELSGSYSTPKDLKRAMMKTVSSQKQKTDEAIRYGVSKFKGTKREDDDEFVENVDESSVQNGNNEESAAYLSATTSQPYTGIDHNREKRRGRIKLRKYMTLSNTLYGEHSRSRSRSKELRFHKGGGSFSDASTASDNAASDSESDKGELNNKKKGEEEQGEKKCSLKRSNSADNLNNCEVQENRRLKQYELRRSHSFSLVCGIINRYETSAYSEIQLAEMYQRCANSSSKLQSELLQLGETTSNVDSELQNTNHLLAGAYTTVEDTTHSLEQVCAQERSVKAQLADAEALTSRLTYEARMLDAKLRDVEEAVDSFQLKVSNLESRMDRIVNNNSTRTQPRRKSTVISDY